MLRTQTIIGLQDCKLKLKRGTTYPEMLVMIIDFGNVSEEDSLEMIKMLSDNIAELMWTGKGC